MTNNKVDFKYLAGIAGNHVPIYDNLRDIAWFVSKTHPTIVNNDLRWRHKIFIAK